MPSEHQKALAQPLTNQNAQQQETNQDTMVTANLKNWSSLSLFSPDIFDLSAIPSIPSNLRENQDVLIVYGKLSTSSQFNNETTLSPSNQLDLPIEQFLPDEEIQIIVLAEPDKNRISNVTSVRTDEFGFFWAPVYAPPPRVLLVIAYFEGNENIFPTYEVFFLCELCN
jgi:hypothetical protein